MRRGVAQSVPWVGKASWRRGCHGIGNLLARSGRYHAAPRAAAYPSDVILLNHIQYTLSCLFLPW